MSKRAPIKIPKLYPEETLEIEGNKVVIGGYKPADKPFVIAMKHIQKDVRPIMKKISELQRKIKEISTDEDGNQIPDKELEQNGALEEVYNIMEEANNLNDEIGEIQDQLVEGDSKDEEVNGPAYFLAQRGLKRFYYPGKTSKELDEIDNIGVGTQYILPIANTMIELTKPPQGLERSIKFAENQKADDKGKPDA